MRAISRTVDISPNTVNSILLKAGRTSAEYHDAHVRNVKAGLVQCDEIWSFIYAKQDDLGDAVAPPPSATWFIISDVLEP